MTEPKKIRIAHDPTADHFLLAKITRLDVGVGEPQCLSRDVTIAPGDTVSLPLHCGAVIVLTEAPPKER